jgi:hypothetical protein
MHIVMVAGVSCRGLRKIHIPKCVLRAVYLDHSRKQVRVKTSVPSATVAVLSPCVGSATLHSVAIIFMKLCGA